MIKNILLEIRRNRKYRKKIIIGFIIFIVLALILIYFSSKIKIQYTSYDFYYPKTEITESRELKGKLCFNDAPDTSIFSDLITESIENAQKSIEISLYSLEMSKIKDALVDASERGVNVSLIFDKSKKSQHDRVFGKKTGLNILHLGGDIEAGGDYMHHKFAIFDGETDNAKLLFGSFNYTSLQEKYDPSFIFETRDKNIIEAFIQENNLMSKNIRGYRKLRENDFKPFNRNIQYKNGFVEIWFCPGFRENSVKQRMIDLINSAEKSIDIIIWRTTDNDITKELFKKAIQGIDIKIITDDYYIWAKNSAFKNLADRIKDSKLENIEIISDLYRTLSFKSKIEIDNSYFNPYIHQHTLIIDDKIVLSGTNNWSYNGFYKNDESIIVSDIDFWVSGFKSSFQRHYNELRGKNIALSIREKENILYFPENSLDLIGYNIVIYNELSEIKEIPEKCFQEKITESKFFFHIPRQCNTLQSLIFILDDNDNLISSSYLNF